MKKFWKKEIKLPEPPCVYISDDTWGVASKEQAKAAMKAIKKMQDGQVKRGVIV